MKARKFEARRDAVTSVDLILIEFDFILSKFVESENANYKLLIINK